MPLVRTMFRIVWAHKVYIAIYLVMLSFIGVFIGLSMGGASPTEYHRDKTSVAVIDHDGSVLSRGLASYLESTAEVHDVADDKQAIQDAVAKDTTSLIVVIPEGWGSDLRAAAERAAAEASDGTSEESAPFSFDASSDSDAPALQTYVSYQSGAGTMMSMSAVTYANSLYGFCVLGGRTDAQAVADADEACADSTPVNIVAEEATPLPDSLVADFSFATYPLLASITVSIAVLMAQLNRPPVRRRLNASPETARSRSVQLFFVCLAIGVISWAWIAALGVALFGIESLKTSPALVGMCVLALLVSALVSSCLGFLLGQLKLSENAANAVANILGMTMSFLGGAMVPLDFMPNALQQAARFTPSYWCTSVITEASTLSNVSAATIAPLFADLGIAALFGVALFFVALAIGRARPSSNAEG